MTHTYDARLSIVRVTETDRTRRTQSLDHFAIENAADLTTIGDRIAAHLAALQASSSALLAPSAGVESSAAHPHGLRHWVPSPIWGEQGAGPHRRGTKQKKRPRGRTPGPHGHEER